MLARETSEMPEKECKYCVRISSSNLHRLPDRWGAGGIYLPKGFDYFWMRPSIAAVGGFSLCACVAVLLWG